LISKKRVCFGYILNNLGSLIVKFQETPSLLNQVLGFNELFSKITLPHISLTLLLQRYQY
jgi:hypothetical protein